MIPGFKLLSYLWFYRSYIKTIIFVLFFSPFFSKKYFIVILVVWGGLLFFYIFLICLNILLNIIYCLCLTCELKNILKWLKLIFRLITIWIKIKKIIYNILNILHYQLYGTHMGSWYNIIMLYILFLLLAGMKVTIRKLRLGSFFGVI